MPTADRTTIRAAVDELVNKLRSNLSANPPTVTKPFWKVAVGAGGVEEYPRPFLTVHMLRARVVGTSDDDKAFEVTVRMRMVTDVSASDPHGAVLDRIGAVEDYLDSIRDSGVISGAEGPDDRTWSFDYPRTTSGARTATAEAEQTFVVKVQRTYNRIPAT